MDDGGQVGLILPAHRLSHARPMQDIMEQWSVSQDLLPKTLFPGVTWPVVFAMFVKEQVRRFRGFFLFDECTAVGRAPENVRMVLVKGARRKGVWRAVIEEAIKSLGGKASLDQIYSYIQGRKPKPIPTWQATIRRELQGDAFIKLENHTFELATTAGVN